MPTPPIDPHLPRETQCIQVLMLGHDHGWWQYMYVDGRGADRRFHIVIDNRERSLTLDEVLPWALGVADQRGTPELVAYRSDLMPKSDENGSN